MDEQSGQMNIPHNQEPNQSAAQQADAVAPLAQAPVMSPSGPAPQETGTPTTPVENSNVAESQSFQEATPQTVENPMSNNTNWRTGEEKFASSVGQSLPEDVSWTADEFVEHPKSTGWYVMLMAGALVLVSIDYLLFKDIISTGVIIIAAATFGVYAGHKPHTQEYYLSSKGLEIGNKLYSYGNFKAFSVADEGSSVSIVFTPLARFAPSLTIYVKPDIESMVVEYLSIFLPSERRRADVVDGLLRRIRF
jgi:hypothetical protein